MKLTLLMLLLAAVALSVADETSVVQAEDDAADLDTADTFFKLRFFNPWAWKPRRVHYRPIYKPKPVVHYAPKFGYGKGHGYKPVHKPKIFYKPKPVIRVHAPSYGHGHGYGKGH